MRVGFTMKTMNYIIVLIMVILLSSSNNFQIQATIIEIVGHNDDVNDAYWSPDGKTIVSGSDDGQVIVWNSSNAEFPVYSIDWDYSVGDINSVQWNSDGTKILSGNQNSSVNIWDISDSKLEIIRISKELDQVNIADWSFDDTQIAIGTNTGKVLIFDSIEKKLQMSLNLNAGSIVDLDYNPVKDLIAISFSNGSLVIWNSASNEIIKINYPNVVSSLSWISDGSALVVGESNNVHFISEIGEEKSVLNDASSIINALSLNNDDTLLATGSEKGIINIWDLLTGTKTLSFDINEDSLPLQINSLDWNKENKLLVATTSWHFHIWDIHKEKIELAFGYTHDLDPPGLYLEQYLLYLIPPLIFLSSVIFWRVRKYKK